MKSGRKIFSKINDTLNLNLITSQAYILNMPKRKEKQKEQREKNTKKRERKRGIRTCNKVCCCCSLWTPSNTRIYHNLQRIRRVADSRRVTRERERWRGREKERRGEGGLQSAGHLCRITLPCFYLKIIQVFLCDKELKQRQTHRQID